MAFWGVEVKPGNPFTHEFDHSKGRLHISMATLGFGKATKKSMLQCNVGDRSPVYLCSLNPGSAESLQLNLELEEVDDVVFTVIGPRSIHLCGYYLRRAISRVPHPSDDNHSESYGEDIADTESERSDRSNDDEDEHEDSFIDDDGDPEVFSDEEEASRDNGPKGKKSSLRRLRKYQAIESDDDDEVFEGKIVNDSMDGGTEGTDKEDSLLISSMYKNHKASQTVLDQEMDAIGDRGAVDARKENGEDDGDRIIHKDLRNCNDFADCQTHGEATLEDNFVNPCTVLDVGDTIKLKKKKKGKEKVQEKETKISFTGHSNKLENNEQDETKMDKTQDHWETETMDRTLPSSVIRDGKLGKREREEQSKEGVCLTANGAYGSNLFNLPEINEHNRKTTVDEDAEISDKAALPSAEKDSEKSRAKRRKKRQVNKGLDVEGGNGYHGDIVEKYKANINTAESGNPKLTNEKDAEISDKAALPFAEKDSEKCRAKWRKKGWVNKGLDVEGGNGYHGDIVEKYKANSNTAESVNPKLTNEKHVEDGAHEFPDGSQNDEKVKKRKKKSKSESSSIQVNSGLPLSVNESSERDNSKHSRVRTLANGLVIEELAMGKKDGKTAVSGKKISIHYTGKLKENGEVFDSNVGQSPFKFRLGKGQVIEGWDVGLEGMQVGEKRRLEIPPSQMTTTTTERHGATIPSNSWLVYDFELVKVH